MQTILATIFIISCGPSTYFLHLNEVVLGPGKEWSVGEKTGVAWNNAIISAEAWQDVADIDPPNYQKLKQVATNWNGQIPAPEGLVNICNEEKVCCEGPSVGFVSEPDCGIEFLPDQPEQEFTMVFANRPAVNSEYITHTTIEIETELEKYKDECPINQNIETYITSTTTEYRVLGFRLGCILYDEY
jgi:hypothetical protein